MLEESRYARRQDEIWPELPYGVWKQTQATLHMWTQIVGKIELELNPVTNHWWETALLVTPLGLSTYPIYFNNRSFNIEFNFYEHLLRVCTSEGIHKVISLETLSVSEFYFELMKLLSELGINVKINTLPLEITAPVHFPDDKAHHTYQRVYAKNFHKILLQADRLMKIFRGNFIGKSTPVHFFWGSFDLAVTRFSGREAKSIGATNTIMKEAYSHEVMSVGFWPGGGALKEPTFYAYASPEPIGLKVSDKIKPKKVSYDESTKSFILRYSDVRKVDDPDQMILDFFESTYEASATLGGWDRKHLERNFH